ncbi:MAG TPA: hypothetical protein VH372_08405, partial [Actinospica sp.]|nr:hypothetical protein [Actinospica sp.]
PGIYALQCGPPTAFQRAVAALLYAGEGSMLTGLAALAEHRLTAPQAAAASPSGLPVPRLDVLVPQRVRRQNVGGVRVIRTSHLPVPIESEPIESGPPGAGRLRIAPLARAVVDACLAFSEAGDAAATETLVATALADGRVVLAELEDELGHAPRRHSGMLRTHLNRLRTSARVAASNQLADALDEAAGPGGAMHDVIVYQDRRRVARTAALWPTRAVAAAVDPTEHEIRALLELGFAVVQIAPHQVALDLPGVLRQLRAVLAARPEATLPANLSFLSSTCASPTCAPDTSAAPATTATPRKSAATPQIGASTPQISAATIQTSAATTAAAGSSIPARTPSPARSAALAASAALAYSAAPKMRPTSRSASTFALCPPPADSGPSLASPGLPPASSRSPSPGAQRALVLTASSPARTGSSSLLPRGGTGQT